MKAKPIYIVTRPDLRQQWQIDQGKACGCRGTDDMCACQNESPQDRADRAEAVLHNVTMHIAQEIRTQNSRHETADYIAFSRRLAQVAIAAYEERNKQ
jgi:hypothetical protein